MSVAHVLVALVFLLPSLAMAVAFIGDALAGRHIECGNGLPAPLPEARWIPDNGKDPTP